MVFQTSSQHDNGITADTMGHNGHGTLAVYNNNDSRQVLLAVTATYMGKGAEIIQTKNSSRSSAKSAYKNRHKIWREGFCLVLNTEGSETTEKHREHWIVECCK